MLEPDFPDGLASRAPSERWWKIASAPRLFDAALSEFETLFRR